MASATVSGQFGAGQSGPGLRVGNVFSRAFPVWRQLIGPFSLLYAIQVLPTIIQATSVQPHHVPVHGETVSPFGWPLAVATIFGLLIALVTHGATYVAATRVMDGASPSVLTAIEAAMGRFLPLLGAWICAGFLMIIGTLLFFVPGLMVYVAYFIIGPVCVLERLGPTASLKRSAGLTKGSRWRIFGLLLLLGVISGLTNALSIPAKMAFGPLPGAFVQLVFSVVLTLFSTIVVTIVYRDLTESKDGFGGSRIAAVFD